MSQAAISHPHLLIVDDDPDILETTQEALVEEGYRVTPATSLPDSLTLVEEQLFHYILTDLFARQEQDILQSVHPLLTQAAPTPVGVITAWPVSEEAAKQAGYACLLRKSFELDVLVRAVHARVQPRLTGKQQQARIIQAFFTALSARDWKRIARLCTPEIRVAPLSSPAISASGSRCGLFSLREALERRLLALPGYTIEDIRIYNRPLGLAVRYAAHWPDSSGSVHRVAGSMHFRFQGDRIAQIETLL